MTHDEKYEYDKADYENEHAYLESLKREDQEEPEGEK